MLNAGILTYLYLLTSVLYCRYGFNTLYGIYEHHICGVSKRVVFFQLSCFPNCKFHRNKSHSTNNYVQFIQMIHYFYKQKSLNVSYMKHADSSFKNPQHRCILYLINKVLSDAHIYLSFD